MAKEPEESATEVPVKKFKIEELEDRIMPSHLGVVIQLPPGASNASHTALDAVNKDPGVADASHQQARIIGIDMGG